MSDTIPSPPPDFGERIDQLEGRVARLEEERAVERKERRQMFGAIRGLRRDVHSAVDEIHEVGKKTDKTHVSLMGLIKMIDERTDAFKLKPGKHKPKARKP
jgi:hypothetical protein